MYGWILLATDPVGCAVEATFVGDIVVDGGVGGEEALGGGTGLESLLLSFSSTDRQM
jgi:hypothetical protein